MGESQLGKERKALRNLSDPRLIIDYIRTSIEILLQLKEENRRGGELLNEDSQSTAQMMHQRKLFKAPPQLEFNEERRVLLSSQA